MRLSIAIQHHPRRAHLLPGLLAALEPLGADVVADPDPDARTPSPWRTYRRALEETPTGVTHRVVLQDDAVPCRSFAAVLERAVAARPDRLLVLCVCNEPARAARAIRSASWRGEPWAVIDASRWVPAVALAWPARLVGAALAYVDAQAWPQEFRADDEIIGRAARGLRETVLGTVPSLVAHEDVEPSLIRRRARASAARVTACFAGPECDPLTIDWAPGPA